MDYSIEQHAIMVTDALIKEGFRRAKRAVLKRYVKRKIKHYKDFLLIYRNQQNKANVRIARQMQAEIAAWRIRFALDGDLCKFTTTKLKDGITIKSCRDELVAIGFTNLEKIEWEILRQ